MLPKKGNLCNCNNWQGITLLSFLGKVFSSALLQSIKTQVDNIQREEQAGFQKGTEGTDLHTTISLNSVENFRHPP